jgi:hypothetical protein
MPTEEMLKKLLDEFAEKETLVSEEIKVVIDEISQLEAKIALCQRRLSTISADRERVLAMRDRYLAGNFPSVPAAAVLAAASAAAAQASPPTPQPGVAGAKAQAAVTAAKMPAAPQPVVSAVAEPDTAFQSSASAAGSGQQLSWTEPPLASKQSEAIATGLHNDSIELPLPTADPDPPAATASAIPAAPAYPQAQEQENDAAPVQEQTATPLQELRKRFGLSNLLGPKKSAETKTSSLPPPAPWGDAPAQSPPAQAEALDAVSSAVTLDAPVPVLSPGQHGTPTAAWMAASANTNVSPAPPVISPSASQSEEEQSESQTAEEEKEEKDNDTVKSINDALRSLFR